MSSGKAVNLFDGKQKKCKENKGGKPLVPVLSPPYAQKWPDIKKEHHRMIMDEIERTFKCNLADQSVAKKRWKLKKNHPEYTTEKIEEVLAEIFSKKSEYAGQDLRALISMLDDPTKIQDKKQLNNYVIMGTQVVTRHLERKQDFDLILCCSSGGPLIHESILCLALLNGVPVCALKGLSNLIAPLLELRYVGVIGFKKTENSPFKELSDFIADKIPDVETPWMRLWKEKYSTEANGRKDIEDSHGDSVVASSETKTHCIKATDIKDATVVSTIERGNIKDDAKEVDLDKLSKQGYETCRENERKRKLSLDSDATNHQNGRQSKSKHGEVKISNGGNLDVEDKITDNHKAEYLEKNIIWKEMTLVYGNSGKKEKGKHKET